MPGRLLAASLTVALLGAQEAVSIQGRPGDRVILTVEAACQSGPPRPLRMILDTGAEYCVIDTASARGLAVGSFRLREVGGFAGRRRMVLQRSLRSLKSGSAIQASVGAMVMDLSERNRWLDEPVDGLLGMSFLAGRRFLLDPEARRLVWNGVSTGGRRVPLKPRGAFTYVDLKVADRGMEALVDTGATGTLYLGQAPERVRVDADCEMASGIDGIVRLGRGRADLEVFGEAFLRRPVWFGGSSSAILGSAFLVAGPTVFDFQESVLWLPEQSGRLVRAPSLPEDVSFPVWWNRSGREPFLEVSPMPQCHRWRAAGFRPGDRVRRVGGEAGARLTLGRINDLIRDGQVLAWVVARKGRELTLLNPRVDRREDRLEE